jgi:hypothetical protein
MTGFDKLLHDIDRINWILFYGDHHVFLKENPKKLKGKNETAWFE